MLASEETMFVNQFRKVPGKFPVPAWGQDVDFFLLAAF
jgi:hypothetical protein